MRKILAVLVIALMPMLAHAHDKRHPVTPQQKTWFDSLKSGKGPCCSDADGSVLTDNDWETRDGHYRVFIDGKWYDVPDDAVLKGPNLYGPTMVWPIRTLGAISIRCFMPGTMT